MIYYNDALNGPIIWSLTTTLRIIIHIMALVVVNGSNDLFAIKREKSKSSPFN